MRIAINILFCLAIYVFLVLWMTATQPSGFAGFLVSVTVWIIVFTLIKKESKDKP